MEPITRKDLDEVLEKQEMCIAKFIENREKNLERLFEAKLAPIVDTLKSHQKNLSGIKGSDGLVGAVKVLQWGYGLGAVGFGVLIHKVFIL